MAAMAARVGHLGQKGGSMRTISVPVLGVLACMFAVTGHAADPPTIASWFDRVPHPPRTLAEALGKAGVTDRGQLRCNALGVEAFTSALDAHLEPIRASYEAARSEADGAPQTAEEAYAQMAQAQADMQRMMVANQPLMDLSMKYQQELAAVMQKGLPAEKMMEEVEKLEAKYQPLMAAAEAKARAAAPPEKPKADLDKGELPEVLAARKRLDAIEFATYDKVHALRDRHRNGHDSLNETLKTRGAACYDGHVAAAGASLPAEHAAWLELFTQLRRQAVEAEKVLASVQYGAKARTPHSRAELIGRRLAALQQARELAELSGEICAEAAVWSKSKDYASSGGDECSQPSYVRLCGAESIGRDYTTIARNCQARKKR
jgi:hypothetical protein